MMWMLSSSIGETSMLTTRSGTCRTLVSAVRFTCCASSSTGRTSSRQYCNSKTHKASDSEDFTSFFWHTVPVAGTSIMMKFCSNYAVPSHRQIITSRQERQYHLLLMYIWHSIMHRRLLHHLKEILTPIASAIPWPSSLMYGLKVSTSVHISIAVTSRRYKSTKHKTKIVGVRKLE